MKAARLGSILVLGCCLAAADAKTVWIDTDPVIGSPFREVDDTFALILAFHSPELRIAGISTTYGNGSLAGTTRAASELTTRFGAAANLAAGEVYPGARSAAEMGHATPATAALISTLRGEKKLTYLALGPLTNLATLLLLHPELSDRIERIIFVGGTAEGTKPGLGPRGTFHIHDANVFKDPAAVRVVLRSRVPWLLAPVTSGARLTVTPWHMRKLRAAGGAGDFLARNGRFWLLFWTRFVGMEGGPVFDALPVLAAARPDLIPQASRHAAMDSLGNLLFTEAAQNSSQRVQVCLAPEPKAQWAMMERLPHDQRPP